MPLERPAPPPSSKTLRAVFVCALAALCLAHDSAAQSGRRTVKKVSPVPAEPAAAPPSDRTAGRITSVIICGHDISKGRKEIVSTNVSTVVR
ncbi:MAG TPA: hypothetical protein VF621_13005, partial [Pyrinomonadaceae bacterium]